MYRIMIVEDDEVIARAVQQSLVSWGMDAFCVQDFSGVLAEFAVKNPQLVLMDIHLPFFNGFHWCQEIRKVSKVPVIFCQLNPLSPVIQHTTSRIEHGTAVLEEIRFSGKFVGAAEHRLDFGGQDT